MTLGAEDVQPAEGDDLFVFLVGLRLEVLEDPLIGRLRDAVERVEVIEVDELFVLDEALFALRQTLGNLLGERLLPGHELGVAAEQNVGPSAGHVGGDGHRPLTAGLGHELGFLGVVLRVEDHVFVGAAAGRRAALQPAAIEHGRDSLGLLDRHRADEHRPSLGVLLDNLGHDRVPLFLLGAEDEVGVLDPPERTIRRDDDDIELVDLRELFGLGVGRAGHTRQLAVFAEIVLEGDGRERLVLALDLDLFLGLDRLVQPVAPAPAGHQAAGELVHDDDFAVLDHVVDVALEQRVRAQRLVGVMEQRHVRRIVQAARLQPVRQHLLGFRHAAFGQRDRLVLLVDDVVAGGLERLALLGLGVSAGDRAGLEAGNDPVDLVVEVGRFLGGSRDDQRRARLVDQNTVDFVHNREAMPALHVVRELELHVVAKVVESEFVVGAVGDVRRVGHLAFRVVQVVLDHADRHAQKAVDPPHPLGVAAGQVVVDRDDVHALAFESVEIRRKRGDQRLAFAGLHLGDLALVQHGAANELDVEVPHVQHAAARLAHDGEGLGHEVVERLAPGQPLAERGRLGAQLFVAERADRRLECVDFADDRTQTLELALV